MNKGIIAFALSASILAYVALPSKGKCEGTCGKGTCPTGTATSDGSACNCKGVNDKECGCKGETKCYDNQGRLLATVACSGQCEWVK